jgi:SAM-dependent methyltransferase
MNNDIQVFSTVPYNGCPYMAYYKNAVEGHFWIEWRFHVFLQQIQGLNILRNVPLKGLDIGCGNGVVRRQIESATDWIVDGADLASEALQLNHTRRGQTFQYNVFDCHRDFKAAYDFIILFDVIEHISDPKRFLEAVWYHLKPSGWVFMNVPALNCLFSNYDRVQNHLRRYTGKMMQAELPRNLLAIRDMRYWGFILLPLVGLRKFLVSNKTSPQVVLEKGFKMPSSLMNTVFLKIMRLETTLLKKPILGTSLMTAAMKVNH